MSPLQLENRILTIEKSVTDFLTKKSWFFPVGIFICASYIFFSYSLWFEPHPEWSRFYLFQNRYWGSLVMALGAIFYLAISYRFRTFYFLMLMALSWLIPCFQMGVYRPIIAAPVGLVLILTLIVSRIHQSKIFGLSLIGRRWVSLIAVIASFLFTIWLIAEDARISSDFRLFQFFWTLHFEMLLFFFVGCCFSSQPTNLLLALNPLQLWSPLTWPDSAVTLSPSSQDYVQKLRRLKVSGLLQVILSNFQFLVILLLMRWLPVESDFFGAFSHYLYFLLTVTAAFGAVTGFLKLFGYQATDATYFIFLAKSPLEIWQRGSIYMSKFLFQFVYLPVWKRTRRIWLASATVMLVVFFHLNLFHEFFLREFIRWMTPSLPIASASLSQTLLIPLLWSLVWLMWIGVFQISLKSFPALRESKGAWVAIVITHIGSSQILSIAKWLAQATGLAD